MTCGLVEFYSNRLSELEDLETKWKSLTLDDFEGRFAPLRLNGAR